MNRFLLSQLNKAFLLLALVTVIPISAHADDGGHQDTWLDEINWHGFVSQSFVGTDENDFLGSCLI